MNLGVGGAFGAGDLQDLGVGIAGGDAHAQVPAARPTDDGPRNIGAAGADIDEGQRLARGVVHDQTAQRVEDQRLAAEEAVETSQVAQVFAQGRRIDVRFVE